MKERAENEIKKQQAEEEKKGKVRIREHKEVDRKRTDKAEKEYAKAKAEKKLKRHDDAVLAIFSPNGIKGTDVISASADFNFRIWSFKNKTQISKIGVSRPTDEELDPFMELSGYKFQNITPDHPLNSVSTSIKTNGYQEKYLKDVRKNRANVLVCVCFSSNKMFSGYGDGLICFWPWDYRMTGVQTEGLDENMTPLFGHTNRINQMEPVFGTEKLFSSSNDCTVRQWDTERGLCEKVFQFTDPIYVSVYDKTREMLFTGGWDRQIRAIDLNQGIVDQSFAASKEAIRTLHLFGKLLFVAGQDPTIRAYDLENGQIKEYKNQHKSWVTCLLTYPRFDEKGIPKPTWLFSGSDDGTIVVWEVEKAIFVTDLSGHKNGVTCIAIANNQLFSGSLDNYIRTRELNWIEEKVSMLAQMAAEDLKSRQLRKIVDASKKVKGKGKAAPSKGPVKGRR